jgi:hypothetical protein
MSDPFRLEALPSELVTFAAFRAALNISGSTLNYLIKRGRVSKPIRLHGRLYWSRKDVEFYVNQRRHLLGLDMETGR